MDDEVTSKAKPFDLTLIPSICNKQIKDSGSLQQGEETVEFLNICN